MKASKASERPDEILISISSEAEQRSLQEKDVRGSPGSRQHHALSMAEARWSGRAATTPVSWAVTLLSYMMILTKPAVKLTVNEQS